MNKLILTVGLPRSGKSTWARKYSKEHAVPVVEPDAVRLALHGQPFIKSMEPYVWAISRTMVESLFISGYDTVIVDATHTRRQWREQWNSRKWSVFYKEFKTDTEECIRRANADGVPELIPIIKRMSTQFQPIDYNKESGEEK